VLRAPGNRPETLNAANRGTELGLLGLRARLCYFTTTVHYLTGGLNHGAERAKLRERTGGSGE